MTVNWKQRALVISAVFWVTVLVVRITYCPCSFAGFASYAKGFAVATFVMALGVVSVADYVLLLRSRLIHGATPSWIDIDPGFTLKNGDVPHPTDRVLTPIEKYLFVHPIFLMVTGFFVWVGIPCAYCVQWN
ncbi:MAG: hypothetical protein HOO99_06500 [Hyphomicrobiaceae bacterium]|nr:hypothetical protein [Hyphomicrobiaceae bacterium]